MSFPRVFPSDSVKYQILVKQKFACAQVSNYTCPILGRLFDEAGYDIDHVLPLADGGSNDVSNLQALCPSCHRVKTARENRDRDRILRALMAASAPVPPAAASAAAVPQTPPAPQPQTETAAPECITDPSRVKNRLSDYIYTHYTKCKKQDGVSVSEFLAHYKLWEAKNIKKRKALPCDEKLVKNFATNMCSGLKFRRR